MITITALLRAKAGDEDRVLAALRRCAEDVRADEPGTLGFFVSQDLSDPRRFTTYERFVDEAAMERHNAGAASRRFFEAAGALLEEGSVTLVKAREVASRD